MIDQATIEEFKANLRGQGWLGA